MARPRSFDEALVLSRARSLFASQGYHGTSIDDIVQATGVLRGSLYKAFGSKRHLFERIFADLVANFDATPDNMDLLTVALKDLAQSDAPIRALCESVINPDRDTMATRLGTNLINKTKGK